MDRTKFRWKVPIADQQTGKALEVEVESHWSPDSADVHDAISMCGRIQAWLASGKTKLFLPNGVAELLPSK